MNRDDQIELREILFHGFADHSRLAILSELEGGDRRVSGLAEATGLTQPNVSKHLSCLWDCGLVDRERKGREVHYRLVGGVRDLLEAADALLRTAGERVRACPRYGSARREAA